MIELYNLSVTTYQRVLASTIAVMEKGAAYFEAQGLDINDMVDMRLVPDMKSFAFQVYSVRHHSLGAIEGALAGEFSPPPPLATYDYAALLALLTETLAALEKIAPADINALVGSPMYFRAGKLEAPFSVENFILTFSIPNLYFHATTIYDMLRIKGVPLAKIDFLGQMAIGLPES